MVGQSKADPGQGPGTWLNHVGNHFGSGGEHMPGQRAGSHGEPGTPWRGAGAVGWEAADDARLEAAAAASVEGSGLGAEVLGDEERGDRFWGRSSAPLLPAKGNGAVRLTMWESQGL